MSPVSGSVHHVLSSCGPQCKKLDPPGRESRPYPTLRVKTSPFILCLCEAQSSTRLLKSTFVKRNSLQQSFILCVLLRVPGAGADPCCRWIKVEVHPGPVSSQSLSQSSLFPKCVSLLWLSGFDLWLSALGNRREHHIYRLTQRGWRDHYPVKTLFKRWNAPAPLKRFIPECAVISKQTIIIIIIFMSAAAFLSVRDTKWFISLILLEINGTDGWCQIAIRLFFDT